jgi:hypothetical protein
MSRHMDSAGLFADSFIATMLQDLDLTTQEETGESPNTAREDIDPDTLRGLLAELRGFFIENESLIRPEACMRPGDVVEAAGSDLYMTRVGHGVGFWDSTCWASPEGDLLDKAAKAMGHFEGAYLGDDGKVYL